ncbi:MAG: hypothetical protein IT577_03505 [Verrucomicrobiae bacterium]|nr:hypothetical protein [Verrucomicrobiae bacterium]
MGTPKPAHSFKPPSLPCIATVLAAMLLGHGHASPIVTAPNAPPAVGTAARELADTLSRLFPDDVFPVGPGVPESGDYIALGAADHDPAIRARAAARLGGPESYAVFITPDGPRRIAVLAGADALGAAHAAAALLKRLGCGFYISGDSLPPARRGPLTFEDWDLSDRPLVRERFVFNWHNFLSGCSTWNTNHWRSWIRAAGLGGFNGVMVHAYGNNPMAAFAFEGKEKPVGFLSTTVKGRDWSTPHVNDVRRLWGGEVFDSPVFGPDAGMVPDDTRVAAARALMRDAFAAAEERGMDVYFAVDVDTPTANPPELVDLLPESARFPIAFPRNKDPRQPHQTLWLPNPDTPEGYAYWKAQVDALMENYPQIDCLVAWFRAGGTPWTELKPEEMPAPWRREYEAEIARTPDAKDLKWSHNQFAIAKIVRAFRRALDQGGHAHVRLATGSWRFDFVPAADRFMPPAIPLLPLDYEVLHEKSQLRDAESRAVIREAGAHRPMIPITWAHHDDGHYNGRPYTPFDAFHSRLTDAKASGFGIIHWTTRPLDLYFESLSRQTWASSRDETLAATCAHMASRVFGPDAAAMGSRYLEQWVTGAPRFSRETSDWVIDRRLENVEAVIQGCKERKTLLHALQGVTRSPDQRARADYFLGLEDFIAAFHEAHDLYQRSRDALAKGDAAEARRLISLCHPEPVIEMFARFSSLNGITRGEQGLVVAYNLRWLTHIIGHRQALGLEPLRIKFAPTQHDPLAQAAGRFTFHAEADHRIWACLGTEETRAPAFDLGTAAPPDLPEVCRSGIRIVTATTVPLQPMMAIGKKDLGPPPRLAPGNYRLRLTFLPPTDNRSAAAEITPAGMRPEKIEIAPASPGSTLPIERQIRVAIGPQGPHEITIVPADHPIPLCAAVLERID